MKKRSVVVETIFLQAVIVLIGMGAFAFLLWEPHLEGRNANATPAQIYFNDPFLIYAYVASSTFFVALYQAFKVLRYARRNQILSQATVKALRTIRRCAVALIGFVIVGEVFFLLPYADEPPQAIVLGLLITGGSAVMATVASLLEQVLENAIGLLPPNHATI
jgi:Protein of unknown function (DUF2975)